MRIVRFDKPDALKREAAGLFSAEEQPKEVARPEMVQGALEGSNVEPILEMTKMIALQRSYQGVQQMIDTEHERQKKAIDTFTKPA
jgi:flagellar basal-body rod protein FlgF